MQHPRVLQLIMDSLRYWVLDMHVDGFRFDLASTLARELHEVDRLGAFLDIIHQDPVLSQVKLIAEGCGSFAFKVRARSFNRIDGVRSVHAARTKGDINTATGYLVSALQY